MARIKTTVYVDPDVLRAMRIRAARTAKRHSEVVEEALREYLGLAAVERVRARSHLTGDEAMALAYRELEAERGAGSRRRR
jgi:plasmid stability protein